MFVKTITVGQFRQHPTSTLDEVEAGEVYRLTKHDREIARIVPSDPGPLVTSRRRAGGSNLTALAHHTLRTAASIDELLADKRER